MLLTIDVGNTNITMGVFRGEELLGMSRMTTKRPRTSDEYGMTICGILEHRSIDPKEIQAVIIASVVPDIMHSLTNGRDNKISGHGSSDCLAGIRYRDPGAHRQSFQNRP